MAKVLFTQPAESDIQYIEESIAIELGNYQASDRIVNGILRTAQEQLHKSLKICQRDTSL